MTLQTNLLKWFQKNQRSLPWRKNYRPYEVWISEIMLQQTQMETVVPYFNRWMENFPDLATLARAPQAKVLKSWEGLGYYSRARNLHYTAKQIIQNHGGIFPDDYQTILSLKGVGRYTAGAIASIAFEQNTPIVDANILRVLSRVYTIKTPIDVAKNKEHFWKLQEKLIPAGQARNFNQALMELGALVCASKNPLCAQCPINEFCKAFKTHSIEKHPVKSKRKKMVKVEAAALVIQNKDRYLIQMRPVGKIMGGLWEFPEWKLAQNVTFSIQQIKTRTRSCAFKEFGVQLDELQHLSSIKRNYTHHIETLHVFKTHCDEKLKSKNNWPYAWAVQNDFKKYPFSSAHATIGKKGKGDSSLKRGQFTN